MKERKKYFEEFKDMYKEEEQIFHDFLKYFEKNWLNFKFINVGPDRQRLERTNNSCEGFHSYLSKEFL